MAKTIKWDDAATPAQNARRRLPALVKEYFAAGRDVARGKPSPAAIHHFWLRTRRLDYTLELFQSCYGPKLAQRLEALRRIEQLLEEFDDCATARRIMEGALPPRSPQRIRLRRFLEDRARRKREEFQACWTAEVDAKGQEQAWRKYLAQARQSR